MLKDLRNSEMYVLLIGTTTFTRSCDCFECYVNCIQMLNLPVIATYSIALTITFSPC